MTKAELEAKITELEAKITELETIFVLKEPDMALLLEHLNSTQISIPTETQTNSDWLDVQGACDHMGRLQAFSIGRHDRPGVMLRYVNSQGIVIMCQPYRDARAFITANDDVTLEYRA